MSHSLLAMSEWCYCPFWPWHFQILHEVSCFHLVCAGLEGDEVVAKEQLMLPVDTLSQLFD